MNDQCHAHPPSLPGRECDHVNGNAPSRSARFFGILSTFAYCEKCGCTNIASDNRKMTYSGWKNWETWNVGLWMANDEGLYGIALESKDYATFQETMRELDSTETPDGVAYNDSGLDISALDAAIVEMRAD